MNILNRAICATGSVKYRGVIMNAEPIWKKHVKQGVSKVSFFIMSGNLKQDLGSQTDGSALEL
jgi:hypothetical protein